MTNFKPICSLASHFKLSSKQCPLSDEERNEMKKVPYASAVGSLMYVMVCTRPDIAHVVGMVSQFLSNPGKEHWSVVKWILRYLKGTSSFNLCFGNNKHVLDGYTDAYMAGDVDSRKSTSGYLMKFAGGAVLWQSRLQKYVALSTIEAEYITLTKGGKKLLWMKKFLYELSLVQENLVLHCDSAIHLGKHPTFHSRSKHIEVRSQWIRDAMEMKSFVVGKIHNDNIASDMMTEPLSREKFEFCRMKVGLVEPSKLKFTR